MIYALNVNSATERVERYWEMCVGSCHAATALREDYRRQLTRCARELHRLSCLLARVDAADAFQECIVNSLHAKGQAVDAKIMKQGKVREVNRTRIAFHRELNRLFLSLS